MFLADYHIHTSLSPDGGDSMRDMIRASAEKGIKQVCFTDHCDIIKWGTEELSEDVESILPKALEERSKIPPEDMRDIEVRVGIELGEAHYSPERALKIAAHPEADFILGSTHVLKKYGDFFLIRYESMEQCRVLMDSYLDTLLEIAELNYFDVMAHIGYPTRYMARAGFPLTPSLHLHGDKLETLLKLLIQNGRGIEINCSGIRDGCGPFPPQEVLRFYRELGGEIVTVGSDAHKTRDAGAYIAQGYEILRQAGFKYVTTFKKRKAEFIKI
ncbi:MAG: histidinol-phosphatase HisJ family protein [Oscillospiraceae bacterium]|jgi:histidinol-phosphatase (PHP family)